MCMQGIREEDRNATRLFLSVWIMHFQHLKKYMCILSKRIPLTRSVQWVSLRLSLFSRHFPFCLSYMLRPNKPWHKGTEIHQPIRSTDGRSMRRKSSTAYRQLRCIQQNRNSLKAVCLWKNSGLALLARVCVWKGRVCVCVWRGWPAPPSIFNRSSHCLYSPLQPLCVWAVPWVCDRRCVCLAVPGSAGWHMWADRLAERGPLLHDILGSTVETNKQNEDFYLQPVWSGHRPAYSNTQGPK